MAQHTKRGVLLGLPKTTACELQRHPHFAIVALNELPRVGHFVILPSIHLSWMIGIENSAVPNW